jgi:hypothetical protein
MLMEILLRSNALLFNTYINFYLVRGVLLTVGNVILWLLLLEIVVKFEFNNDFLKINYYINLFISSYQLLNYDHRIDY